MIFKMSLEEERSIQVNFRKAEGEKIALPVIEMHQKVTVVKKQFGIVARMGKQIYETSREVRVRPMCIWSLTYGKGGPHSSVGERPDCIVDGVQETASLFGEK